MPLSNLASSLRSRFEQRGVLSDLDEAIDLHRAALALSPHDHADRSVSLNNLANSLQGRFQDSNRFSSLNNLANSLGDKFEQWHILSDLDEAVELLRAALALSSPDHSHRSISLHNLANSLQTRFQQQHLSSDLEEASRLYSKLSEVTHAVSRTDLRAAKSWVAAAEQLQHGSALVAYQTALRFLEQHVAVLSSSSRHFDAIREATSCLAMDAFSCSIRHGALTTAVELVEQGRAVFWTQLARFRTPMDDLSASGHTGKALAEEFKQLSFRLRNMMDASTKDQSPQIQQTAIQWDDVISRIRMLPNFPRFLLPPLFSNLQKAAEDGPVIIVNASQHSCDALIILSAQDPVHIPLDIARAEVSELSIEFQSLIARVGSSNHQAESHKIVGVLRKLWNGIVGPVVQVLRKFLPPVAHASGGVLLPSSPCFLSMQLDPTCPIAIIFLTSTSPLTPQLWQHLFVRGSRFLEMSLMSILLPLVKQARKEGANCSVSMLS
jgi:tetratricopeptide (TPR) repeat protein